MLQTFGELVLKATRKRLAQMFQSGFSDILFRLHLV